MKGVLSWLIRCDFMFCLGCSGRPAVQNIFVLTIHYLYSFVPIAQQAGQAAVLGRLTLSMCLWSFSKPAPIGERKRCRLPGLTNRYTAKKG
jgi:hypothetical protein